MDLKQEAPKQIKLQNVITPKKNYLFSWNFSNFIMRLPYRKIVSPKETKETSDWDLVAGWRTCLPALLHHHPVHILSGLMPA